MIVCVNLDPYAPARGSASTIPARSASPASFVVQDLLTGRDATLWQTRRQLRPARPRRRPRHARPMTDMLRDASNSAAEPGRAPPRAARRRRADGASGSRPTRSGSSAPSSTRSTSAASPTATTTAAATSVGLTDKLDYLQWLGVDCIWLLPMYPSPLRDGGYDIADFYSIHPDYGTRRRLPHASSTPRTSAGSA